MKKVIIIILCVILALDAGVLIYGAIGKSEDVSSDLPGAYQPPAEYVKEGSTKWFDLAAIMTSDLSESDKAANLLVQAGYNHIYAKQFAHLSQTNVYTNSSTPDVYFEILWVQEKYNRFYQSQSHAGSMASPLNSSRRPSKRHWKVETASDFPNRLGRATKNCVPIEPSARIFRIAVLST